MSAITSPATEAASGQPDTATAAIRRLTERGYDATTAEDLAEAVGLSRSTFFRRFRSKDDVVFADHDQALAGLDADLENTRADPREALVDGTVDVLRLLVRDPEAARLRFDLMRHTPALRDRELVITHRYEGVFARYIRRVQQPGTPAWVAPALAASLVAVHNATLRAWLKGRINDPVRSLASELRQVTALHGRWLSPDLDRGHRRVLVAVYDAEGSPEAILDAVSEQLSDPA